MSPNVEVAVRELGSQGQFHSTESGLLTAHHHTPARAAPKRSAMHPWLAFRRNHPMALLRRRVGAVHRIIFDGSSRFWLPVDSPLAATKSAPNRCAGTRFKSPLTASKAT